MLWWIDLNFFLKLLFVIYYCCLIFCKICFVVCVFVWGFFFKVLVILVILLFFVFIMIVNDLYCKFIWFCWIFFDISVWYVVKFCVKLMVVIIWFNFCVDFIFSSFNEVLVIGNIFVLLLMIVNVIGILIVLINCWWFWL